MATQTVVQQQTAASAPAVSAERIQIATSLLSEIGYLAHELDRICYHHPSDEEVETAELLIGQLRGGICKLGWMSEVASRHLGVRADNLARGASAQEWLLAPVSRAPAEVSHG